MRLHEAAPKLIIQERVGERMKISSYGPVPLLTPVQEAYELAPLLGAGYKGPPRGAPFQQRVGCSSF